MPDHCRFTSQTAMTQTPASQYGIKTPKQRTTEVSDCCNDLTGALAGLCFRQTPVSAELIDEWRAEIQRAQRMLWDLTVMEEVK